MKAITILVKGARHEIVVDDEDHDELVQHTWSGFQNSSGQIYATARINGEIWLLHRFVMRHREIDGMIVDHLSRNSLNCCKGNLRITTQQDNIRNSAKCDNAKGVHFDKQRNRWCAQARDKTGKKVNLGRHSDRERAVLAYDTFMTQTYGTNYNL